MDSDGRKLNRGNVVGQTEFRKTQKALLWIGWRSADRQTAMRGSLVAVMEGPSSDLPIPNGFDKISSVCPVRWS